MTTENREPANAQQNERREQRDTLIVAAALGAIWLIVGAIVIVAKLPEAATAMNSPPVIGED